MELIYIHFAIDENGKILVIEENDYSIWSYVYNPATNMVEADGFICNTVPPLESFADTEAYTQQRKPPPLAKPYAHHRSVMTTLTEEDFRVVLDAAENLIIYIQEEPFTIINLQSNTSYSKALSQDGPYGMAWKD